MTGDCHIRFYKREPDQKGQFPLTFEKKKVKNKCTSSLRPKIQYICSLPLNKQAIDWDFIPEVKSKACK